jgi:hypothetical protein
MIQSPERLKRPRSGSGRRGPYALIVRGHDGRARFEPFATAKAYRARLLKLQPSRPAGVSLEDVLRFLDA